MLPKISPINNPQASLFDVPLENIINLRHPLVTLAGKINWEHFEKELESKFCHTNGAPAKPTRLMVGLHYLKHAFNLSDEKSVERWVENPYWQYFCGMKFFMHQPPIDPSLMTRWRKMLGDGGMEKLLAETIEVGFKMKVIDQKSLENVNIDTTVQEKAITYPTDAKLYHAMLKKLTKVAKRYGVKLRQTYGRVSKWALVKAGRYFHARQSKRAMREVRRLKTMLGRVIRDIDRKIAGNASLMELFTGLLEFATRLYNQKKNDKNKIYSIHAPEVECISKGKAHKKYEFGSKASYATTSRENFIIGALGVHGNPYDGHTLSAAIEQVERLCGDRKIGRVFVDQGYKGHDYRGEAKIHICDRRKLPPRLRRHARRRSAIEPIIGHMKNDGRLGRNYLRGKEGDRTNAILSAAGQNLRALIRFFAPFLGFIAFLYADRIRISAGFARFLHGFTAALSAR